MSIFLGDKILAGVATNTIENAHSLLDYKWTDHILNELSWLRADTFSWQSGSVYVGAYNHILADYSGGTSQTETVGSYTITYVLADDGHKITTDETTVSNIYAESGSAWYYILDTVNTRFKLPRENPAREELTSLIQSPVKGNGMTLGWTADGPSAYGTFTSDSRAYTRTGTVAGTILPAANGAGGSQITSTNAYIGITTDGSKSGLIADLSNATKTSVYKGKKYLYFYVGNYSQSAVEQTAGLNASLFNGKADVDLSNAATNASSTAKETIVGWGMPDYSAVVSKSDDTDYIADTNGWIEIYTSCWNSNTPCYLYLNGVQRIIDCASTSSHLSGNYTWIPIPKGTTYKVTLQRTGVDQYINFYPCIGE